jgi:hypothetical protein
MATNASLRWIDGNDERFTVRGLAWYEEARSFRRLPPRAEALVPPGVWGNAQSSSGVRICFRTNAAEMHVRVELNHASGMAHMPSTGQSGVVLFEGEPYRQRPWGQAFPAGSQTEYEGCLFSGVSRATREFALWLPLYNGVRKLEIGVTKGARISPPSAAVLAKPVVFYGTSITMGGCAHTPDADFPSIISRRLNLDTINLGFSGCGKGEPEVAELLAEIDAAMFALDYAANVDAARLKKTLPSVVGILRARHPDTPILLMSRTLGYAAHYSEASWRGMEALRDTMIQFYATMRRKGDANIHFIDGNALLTPCTELVHSDGGHPTSAGFAMMADRLAPQIENILLMRR